MGTTLILEAVRRHGDWFVVVKPKLTNAAYAHVAGNERMGDWKARRDVIALSYDVPGAEICPSGYLIRHMQFAVGMTGTAVFESLIQDKPYFVYYPVVYDTPRVRRLHEAGLWQTTPASLDTALRRFIGDPNSLSVPYDWFRHASDPYGDDCAIDRIVETLYPDAVASSQDAI